MIDPARRFTNKAVKYAKYRWRYSPQAFDDIFGISRLSSDAVVADIGAGTGMISHQLVSRAKAVYAIEPNSEMRELARLEIGEFINCLILDGIAEQIPLGSHTIDLIVVGRALHWFEPLRAKSEFNRILKADGWLAILQVPCTDKLLVEATRSIRVEENGWDTSREKGEQNSMPLDYFFGGNDFSKYCYHDTITESWQEFLGRLSSLSPAPDESHAYYLNYKHAAEGIFQRFCMDGCLTINIATELHLGRMAVD